MKRTWRQTWARTVRLLPLWLATPLLCAQPDPAPQTLHATARLVVVDVVVIDAAGNAVHGLRPEAFHLIERKTPQTLRTAEEHTGEHTGPAGPAARPAASAPSLQQGLFTNAVATPEASAITVLLLDTLNTPMASQSSVRGQLLKYLDSAKSGTRIAIFGLSGRLVMLQGLTSDPEILRHAIDRTHPRASPSLAEKVGGKTDVVADQTAGITAQLAASSPQIAQALAEFNDTEKDVDDGQRARQTLQALNQLARYLAGLPGRKNLIWFSQSFPLSMLPHRSGSDPFAGQTAWQAEYRETVDLLARSRIAVYPVDARGLMPSPTLQASNAGDNLTGRSPRALIRSERAFSADLFEPQSTMFEIAEDTGGQVFVNTNGLAEAVAKVAGSGSDYYTLNYTPSDSNAHGEFRGIRVEVDGKGYKLAYRRGYFAEPADLAASGRDIAKAAAVFGAPPATQIPFYAHVQPLPASESGRKELHQDYYRHYRVEYSADPRALSLSASLDGMHHGSLEYVALAFDSTGRTVNYDVKSVHATWNATQFAAAMQRGVRYEQEIGVPAAGAYSLRVLLVDRVSGKIGSIEIPASDLNQPPLPAH